jgi:hypothetical protein
VLERYRGEIPIEYLRALVDRESNFEPKQRTGSAIGLMQIIPVVLADYNTRNGTHYKPEHPSIRASRRDRMSSSSTSSPVTPGTILTYRTSRLTGRTHACRAPTFG